MPVRVVIAYLAIILIWGFTWAGIKVGVATIPPFVFALERSIAVAVVLTVLAIAFRMPFPRTRRTIGAAAGAGLFNTGISWAIIFWSEQYVPSGLVSVFGATAPVWTAVLAHFYFRADRLTAAKIVALVLGVSGIAVLVGAPAGGSGPEAGVATVLLAVLPVLWAVAAIIQARILRREALVPTVAMGTWFGTAVLVPLALSQAGLPQRWEGSTLVAFGYLVVFGSCVGLSLQMWLSRRLRPTTMTFVQVLTPAEALLAGAIGFGEVVTPLMLVGAVLVVAAVLLNALTGAGAPAARSELALVAAAEDRPPGS